MRIRQSLSVLYVAFLAIFLLQAGTAFAEQAEALKPIEHKYVCMVNDTVMDKPQIPATYEKKTYYGCCMGCVSGLQTDETLRTAKDPVTGNKVDKASAFIGSGPKGEALYFESQETFNTYFKQAK